MCGASAASIPVTRQFRGRRQVLSFVPIATRMHNDEADAKRVHRMQQVPCLLDNLAKLRPPRHKIGRRRHQSTEGFLPYVACAEFYIFRGHIALLRWHEVVPLVREWRCLVPTKKTTRCQRVSTHSTSVLSNARRTIRPVQTSKSNSDLNHPRQNSGGITTCAGRIQKAGHKHSLKHSHTNTALG